MKHINKKTILFLGAFFVILFLTLFFGRDYIFKIFDSDSNINESQVSNQEEENNPSPFGDYISSESSKDSNSGVYTPKVQQTFETAAYFQGSLDEYGYGEWEKILSDKQVIVEVIKGAGEDKEYKLVYSKDSSLKYNEGDAVLINFVLLEPGVLATMKDYSIKFGFSEDEIGSFRNDFLDIGDNLIFTCYKEGCSGGLLSSALVLKK